VVRLLMWMTAPVSWPIGKGLDWMLGKEQPVFGKRQISALVDLHRCGVGAGGGLGGVKGGGRTVVVFDVWQERGGGTGGRGGEGGYCCGVWQDADQCIGGLTQVRNLEHVVRVGGWVGGGWGGQSIGDWCVAGGCGPRTVGWFVCL
jgi:hypothetical protein